jgi:hypothetical protein
MLLCSYTYTTRFLFLVYNARDMAAPNSLRCASCFRSLPTNISSSNTNIPQHLYLPDCSFLLSRSNEAGVHPHKMVIDRIFLVVLRSLWFDNKLAKVHTHSSVESAASSCMKPFVFPTCNEFLVNEMDIPVRPYMSSIGSPMPGILPLYIPKKPSMLLQSQPQDSMPYCIAIETANLNSLLNTELIIARHGFASPALGFRTRSLGSGGMRIGCSFVEAPLGGILSLPPANSPLATFF